jgi:hypothetical protein
MALPLRFLRDQLQAREHDSGHEQSDDCHPEDGQCELDGRRMLAVLDRLGESCDLGVVSLLTI